MRKILSLLTVILLVLSVNAVFANDKIAAPYVEKLKSGATFVSGSLPDKAVDFSVYVRKDGGGELYKVGNGTSDSADGSYEVKLTNLDKLKNGKNQIFVSYDSNPGNSGGEKSSALRAIWLKDGKVYKSRPYDKQAAEIAKLKAKIKKLEAGTVLNVRSAQVKKALAQKVVRLDSGSVATNDQVQVANSTKHEVRVTSSGQLKQFGIVVTGGWKVYRPGTVVKLVAGIYPVNADNGSVWSSDQTSIAMGKAHFELKVNGVVISISGGYDNGVQGGNHKFQLHDDGSITAL
ncbi:MAG: hypothetical protein ABIF17_04850 [Patescibacteria group bacterium]